MAEAALSEDIKTRLYAPFEIITQHTKSAMSSSDRKMRAGDSIISDVLGLKPVVIPPAGKPEYLTDFLYTTLHLFGSYHRYDDFRVMLKVYPWRAKISRKTHCSICMHAILNECYEFEERLKRFFEAIRDCAKATDHRFPSDVARSTLRSYHRSFVRFLRARRVPVHQRDFEPRELGRVGLVELLAVTGDMKELKFALPLAMSDFRKTWLKNVDDAQLSARVHMLAAFDNTKDIWSRLTADRF